MSGRWFEAVIDEANICSSAPKAMTPLESSEFRMED